MRYDESVLTGTEKRIFALRTLYSKYGYRPYRMMKFEDYDLYSRNKDFLLSDRVITFTDTSGKLKALKPDVTLSIVRNIEDKPGEIARLYYDENVYRVSDRTNSFKEIMQMGLECIGDANNPSGSEVLELAAKSLELLAEDHNYVLRVSDIDILTLLVDAMSDSKEVRSELLRLAGSKNIHEITALCKANEVPEDACETFTELLKISGPPAEAMPRLAEICRGTAAEDEVLEMKEVLDGMAEDTLQHVIVDFAIIGDTKYYNGMAMEGYIDGIPECVLIGGRYDMLMRRMKKKSRAIGFAVYLDTLARLGTYAGDDAIERFFN